MRRLRLIPLVFAVTFVPASAQESASYRMDQAALNAGGRPNSSTPVASSSFQVTLDCLGDAISGTRSSSSSYSLQSGFAERYAPPAEVTALTWNDKDELDWSPDPHAVSYNVYSDDIPRLSDLSYGECRAADVSASSWTDLTTPGPGIGRFYLVTAENAIDEEGPKGSRSDGIERQGNECP